MKDREIKLKSICSGFPAFLFAGMYPVFAGILSLVLFIGLIWILSPIREVGLGKMLLILYETIKSGEISSDFQAFLLFFCVAYIWLYVQISGTMRVSAKDDCIYIHKINFFCFFKVSKVQSVLLSEIESLDGEDSVEVSYDEKGNKRVNRTYTLTLYGKFGQKNYKFGTMQHRSEAINAIERAMEYLAEQVAE